MSPPTIVTTEGAVGLVPDRFHTCWSDARPLLVADRNTWEAAGKAVERAFLQAGQAIVEVLLFDEPQQVHADQAHVDAVKQRLGQGDLIAVAIGAGSMNDIVKLASYECGKSYCCVPTAPSVDGYTSPNAPITIQGFKQTIPCTPPQLVVADVTVLRNAPMSMISSGYGDLVAKITGGADWLIADSLGVEPVGPEGMGLGAIAFARADRISRSTPFPGSGCHRQRVFRVGGDRVGHVAFR